MSAPPPPPPPVVTKQQQRGPKTPPGSPTLEEKRAAMKAAKGGRKEGLNIDRELGPDLSRALDKCGNKVQTCLEIYLEFDMTKTHNCFVILIFVSS